VGRTKELFTSRPQAHIQRGAPSKRIEDGLYCAKGLEQLKARLDPLANA